MTLGWTRRYTRIIGELRKLGIKRISRQTERNILKEEGIEPSPDRTSDKWGDFLTRHAETLWAVDFFSVRTVTAHGIREMYLLFLLVQERSNLPGGVIIQEPIDLGDGLAVGHAGFPSGYRNIPDDEAVRAAKTGG